MGLSPRRFESFPLRFSEARIGGPVPSVAVAGPRSHSAWRPAVCTKRESSARGSFVAHSDPRTPGS